MPPFRSGVAAILGPPNAGKSTLLNRLLGQKVAIVTPRPQTTRNRIMGVVNGEKYQIILLDTPGLHAAGKELNRRMVRAALDAAADADVALLLLDVSDRRKFAPDPFARLVAHLETAACPVLLGLNKADLVSADRLRQAADWCRAQYPFAGTITLSALSGEGTAELEAELAARLPEGPQYYPDDMPTDVSERFLAAEIVREAVFLRTRDEVPYATAVMIELFDESARPLRIAATILVERASQKGIIIGKGGAMLGAIREQAAREIARVLERPVRLELWVKVREKWTENRGILKSLGLEG